MSKVYAMAANGTEEAELLTVVDILRRAGVETEIVSISDVALTSSHGVTFAADRVLEGTKLTDCDLIYVPGGMPGSKSLASCKPLIKALKAQLDGDKRVAAICAAPALVLGANGLLSGKKATCFPGFEEHMKDAVVTGGRVETDGNITTARGLGCAIELGLEIVTLLEGAEKADEVKTKIQY